MGAKKADGREPNLDRLSFEQALAKLDDTVRALEAGDLPLAESTRLYEIGMRLSRICSEMLAAAELKISQIKTAYGEQMRFRQDDQPGREDESC